MKSFSLVALTATLAVASAADCDLTKLATVLTDTNVATCTTDSGFSFTAPATPTGTTLTKVCASKACQTVLTAVKALGLGDCTALGVQLETDIINPIDKGCGTTSGSTTGSSAGSKSSTVTVTTPAPATTTATPASTTATSTTGSSASSTTVTTPTPTPTTSTAVKVTVAASTAVVAIAAAFM